MSDSGRTLGDSYAEHPDRTRIQRVVQKLETALPVAPPSAQPPPKAGTGEPANSRQVGGGHYKTEHGLEHWDVVAMFGLDYFQGQITKYVMRHRKKNGIQDLEKARHFLDKYIELERAKLTADQESMYQAWREGYISTSHETDEAAIRKAYEESDDGR